MKLNKYILLASLFLGSFVAQANQETLRYASGVAGVAMVGDSMQKTLQESKGDSIENLMKYIPKKTDKKRVSKLYDVDRYVALYKKDKKTAQRMMYGVSQCKGYYNIMRIHDFNTYGKYSDFYNVQVDALRRVLPWGQPELRIGLQDGITSAQSGDRSVEKRCVGFYNSELQRTADDY